MLKRVFKMNPSAANLAAISENPAAVNAKCLKLPATAAAESQESPSDPRKVVLFIAATALQE
jgi:hypothetical protein